MAKVYEPEGGSEANRPSPRGASSPAALVRAAPDPAFTVTFDGRTLTALPGQSIAAVFWAAGILSWRTTRAGGEPRGAFCGIGSCYDCLATVNGRPNQRACLVAARPGDVITTQEGTGHADLAV
ncbi:MULTISPECIES: (2Fe-2S)-binding protein [unclassified Streptomyces]|uniref:(2Fe-2S)-binding protein n=1 Tax=Streptomyces sp. NBC_00060 TaxID=2975636 RepID=A0AAU2GXL6_9ACTN